MLTVLCAICLVAGTAFPAAAQLPATSTDTGQAEIDLFLGILRDSKIDAAKRRDAALSLLRRNRPESIETLKLALVSDTDPTLQRIVAQAIATMPESPPDSFVHPLLSVLTKADTPATADFARALGRYQSSDATGAVIAVVLNRSLEPSRRGAAIMALGYHRTQYVTGILVRLLVTTEPPTVRASAAGALSQLTGLDDFGDNHDLWTTWWRQHEGLSESDWLHALLNNFARRTEALMQRNNATAQKLIDVQRQLYLTTRPEERPALLVAMLSDKSEATRRLALDLSGKRLIDQQPIEGALLESLRAALDDPSPIVREKTARLLRNLRDPGGADAVAERLSTEPDSQVLHVYLLLLTDLPRAIAVDRAMQLLTDPTLGADAAGMLARSVEEKLLDPTQQTLLRDRLDHLISPDEPPKPKVIELLGRVARPDDWKRIEQWISSEDDAIKTAAAQVWAASDRPLDVLVSRADDPLIQPIVIVVATQRGKTADTLLALIRNRPEQEQVVQAWTRSLIAVAGRVPSEAVLDANAQLIKQESPPELRAQLLSAALEREDESERPTGLPLAQLLIARAEARLATDQAPLALTDLRTIDTLEVTLPDTQQRAREKLLIQASLTATDTQTAMAAAKRVFASLVDLDEPAQQIAADEIHKLFLAAAQRATDANQTDQARQILGALAQLTGPNMSEQSVKQVQALNERLGPAATPGDDSTTTPATETTAQPTTSEPTEPTGAESPAEG